MATFTPAENALIDDCYTLILELMKKADQIVRTGFAELTKTVATKTASWDLVTKYDQEVEQLLIDGILAKYPDHKWATNILPIFEVIYNFKTDLLPKKRPPKTH